MKATLDINLNIHHANASHVEALLTTILGKITNIMATQAELAQSLRDIKAQADKAQAEIIAAVAALEAALAAAGTTTPEVDAALADLKTTVQGLDDLNPDAP